MIKFTIMEDLEILKINETAEKIPNCIRFDKGSAKFPFPEEFIPFIDKIKKEIKGNHFHYPPAGGEQKLKEQIIRLEETIDRQISEEEITITHGGMSGLFNIFYLLIKPGDEVMTNDYCFEGFSALIKHFQAKHQRINLSNINDIEQALSPETKLIILNSPENPSGKVYPEEEIKAVVDLAEKENLWLVSDEVLNQFTYDGIKWQGPPLKTDRIIIVNSFSKNYFVPGIRVGWIETKNKAFIKECDNLLSIQSVGVNLFGQLLMAEIMKGMDYKKFFEERLNILSKRKDFFEKTLKENNIACLHKVEGGMNFYVDLKKDSQKAAPKLLKEHGVAIIPGYVFEGKPSTFARLGFGAVSEDEISRGLEAIKQVCFSARS